MAKNSREKGKKGELDAVRFLKSLGFEDARRTAQHRGNHNAGDVECPESLPHVLVEVKYRDCIAPGTKILEDACYQAERDAGRKKEWCVLHKRTYGNWGLTYFDYGLGVTPTVWRQEDMQLVLDHLETRGREG